QLGMETLGALRVALVDERPASGRDKPLRLVPKDRVNRRAHVAERTVGLEDQGDVGRVLHQRPEALLARPQPLLVAGQPAIGAAAARRGTGAARGGPPEPGPPPGGAAGPRARPARRGAPARRPRGRGREAPGGSPGRLPPPPDPARGPPRARLVKAPRQYQGE